jgi:hypothetical protein
LGDFVLLNKTLFLYTEFSKQGIKEKLYENLNKDEDEIFIKEVDINSEDISNIRNWISKVMISKPKEEKTPVEIVMNFVDEVEKELERQLKEGDGVGE